MPSIQVELLKLGQRRLSVRIPSMANIDRHLHLTREVRTPLGGIQVFEVLNGGRLELQGRSLYLRNATEVAERFTIRQYDGAASRDLAYTQFLSMLTELNGGVDPRVGLQPLVVPTQVPLPEYDGGIILTIPQIVAVNPL